MQQWAYLGKGSIWNERNVKGETNQNMSSAETMTKTILSEDIFEIKPFHKVLIADPWYLKKIASVDKGIHDKKQNNGLPTYDNTAQVETMGGVVM